MEDEDYPETAVEIALYKETLMDKKYTEVPVDGDIVDYNYSRYIYSWLQLLYVYIYVITTTLGIYIVDYNYSRY